MSKRIVSICLCLSMILAGTNLTYAGGKLEDIDITGRVPSPRTGEILARAIPIKWDPRCIPVHFSVNTTLDPIPNPLGPAFLSLAEAAAALQEAFDTWNNIPTSFIDMRITGETSNPGLIGFDMVNELTFRTRASFDIVAESVSVTLIEDTFLADGDDIDGDGDPDVSNKITTCADVDGDGDIEFPEGFYKAGTILDNDVQFNTKESTGSRFTVNPEDADDNVDSLDLIAVAVHEFGHAHGLSHTMINQLSARDGTAATMFPFFDSNDPDNELAFRSLEMDDIAWSSFFYPEGSADDGPAALQPGDIAFDQMFGLITGQLHHGRLNQPVAGGSVFALDCQSGAVVSEAFSGTTQVSLDPRTGNVFPIQDPAVAILDGRYVLPVPSLGISPELHPRGRHVARTRRQPSLALHDIIATVAHRVPGGCFALGIEAADGTPFEAFRVNFTTQVGAFFGQQDFNEEILIGNIFLNPGETLMDIDLVTSRTTNIRNFRVPTNPFGRRGFTEMPPGTYYAVGIPVSQVAEMLARQDVVIRAAEFFTSIIDRSVVPVFAEALLTTGVVNDDGTASVDLENPLERVIEFIGQDHDFAPFFFSKPRQVTKEVRRGIENGKIQNLFLVLRVPITTPFPGIHGVPPLIGLDATEPLFGLSFISTDGGATFTPRLDRNFMFGLVLAEPSRALHTRGR